MDREKKRRIPAIHRVTILFFLLCTSAFAAEATPLADREWKQFPAIADLPPAAVVYALGDVHADCDKMLSLLAAAKLISGVPTKPDQIRWTGETANLVITGDMIDKYTQSLAVLETLRALEPQAAKAGGRLVVCLGNHEAEFLAAGGDAAKNAEFGAEMKAAGISGVDVAAGRDADGLGAWLRTRPVGARIGAWFFCHAGNTGGRTLPALKADLEKDLTEKGYETPLLMNPNSMLEARMHPRPWWTATADPSLHDSAKHAPAHAGQSTAPPALVASISALGADHLVIGHQPGKIKFDDGVERKAGEVFVHYNGLLFMIDTGMSRGAEDGRSALLRIHTTPQHVSAIAVYADGKTRVLWEK
jgi:hypothetical protein